MDKYLDLTLDLFKKIGITPNLDKLKRQLSIIEAWFKHSGVGCLEAITGFGKTYVAIIAIYRLNLKYPDEKVYVIVPSIKLWNDWQEHIDNFELKNVTVYVVNTYTSLFINNKVKHKCFLLICDEIHNYLSEDGIQFNQTITGTDYTMFLGLSATLDDKEKAVLDKLKIPIVDKVTMSEGLRFGYVSKFKVYNYGIDLDGESFEKYNHLNDVHNSNFSKFNYFVEGEQNWELIRACTIANESKARVGQDWRTGKQWRDWYANTMGWNGDKEHPWSPANISKYAQQWNWAMTQRKNFIHNHESKVLAARNIVNFLDTQTITFAENTSFADNLTNLLGSKAMAYHTNLQTGYEYIPKEERRKQLVSAKRIKLEHNGKIEFDHETKEYIISYQVEKKVSAVRLKKLAITKFESGEIKVLNTAKALDEGFNVEGINCAIICGGSSKKRQYIQRIGRSLRFIEGKTAKIINIYIKNTQDEKWLKARQKGDSGIIWIDKIEDLNL